MVIVATPDTVVEPLALLKVVMVALQPYPEARIAVADRLAEVES